jgi:hypothetical protein
MNAVDWRGLERIIIVLAAMIISILGYLLFKAGITSYNTVDVKTSFGKIIISGTGPGLSFMIFSVFVLIYAIKSGGASVVTDAKLNQVTESLDTLKKSHENLKTQVLGNSQELKSIETLKSVRQPQEK